MKDTVEILLMVAAVVIGIIGAVNKNRKKAEESGRQGKSRGKDQTADMWRVWREAGSNTDPDANASVSWQSVDSGEDVQNPKTVRRSFAEHSGTGRSFADALRHIVEQADADAGTASSTVAPRPIATPSFPMAGWKPTASRSAASARQVVDQVNAPPQTVSPLPSHGQPAAISNDYYSLETEYDWTDGREQRPDYGTGRSDAGQRYAATKPSIQATGAGIASIREATQQQAPEATAATAQDGAKSPFAEIVGDEFDLRRAVIEAEILRPKYI